MKTFTVTSYDLAMKYQKSPRYDVKLFYQATNMFGEKCFSHAIVREKTRR